MRIRSARTPPAASCSAESCWWVVEAGWITKVRAFADVRQVRGELQVRDDLLARRPRGGGLLLVGPELARRRHAEGEDRARASGRYFFARS